MYVCEETTLVLVRVVLVVPVVPDSTNQAEQAAEKCSSRSIKTRQ